MVTIKMKTGTRLHQFSGKNYECEVYRRGTIGTFYGVLKTKNTVILTKNYRTKKSVLTNLKKMYSK